MLVERWRWWFLDALLSRQYSSGGCVLSLDHTSGPHIVASSVDEQPPGGVAVERASA
ncbi:hypothetical protein [Kribbella sp. CA-294648]|uniref:hypothetical protein n=1 Tax=Kribbella sp. CA-294648 TaxID=3239948 RepID=UPI003D8B6F95